MNIQALETSAEHVGAGIASFLKAFLHFAAVAAPVAATVAKATGHEDVVGDINKAGQAANAASSVIDNLPTGQVD